VNARDPLSVSLLKVLLVSRQNGRKPNGVVERRTAVESLGTGLKASKVVGVIVAARRVDVPLDV
jgi:hypothetical protein